MKIKLLRQAYAIIDGIPDNRINLDVICRGPEKGNAGHCGTIACAAGWLAMHPKFIKRGMYIDEDGQLDLKDGLHWYDWDDILSIVFDCSVSTANKLFGPTWYDEDTGKTEKQIWQKRVRKYLKKHSHA